MYVPISRLEFTVLHLMGSGNFSEDGVKKLVTAFSSGFLQRLVCMKMTESSFLLVVVDSILFFEGGGETEPCLASAIRFDERLKLITSYQ